ncbi:MAG: hypothetical protein JO001_29030 [Alphaproteobacteria bacterium]|nr:hypothetical protein [Alphaproteobacteria bacterium]
MGLHVLEIHHHAIRIDPEPQQLNAVQSFSKDVLGLDTDPGRRQSSVCPASGSMSANVALPPNLALSAGDQ